MQENSEIKKEVMKDYYDELYSEEMSFREKWEGKIGIDYKVPKEVGCLIDFLKDKDPSDLSILELGAGDGVSARMIIKDIKPKRYVGVDLSKKAVENLRKKGIESQQMDVTSLEFEDNSFDVVCCFNVMHHVDDPKKMAQEMLRVSKKFFLLCEANGMSVPRKILEFTPRNRRANEHSYLPSTYKSFFQNTKLDWAKTKPFNFAFAFTPNTLFNAAVWLSELMEKIPLFRWQGSSLLIYGGKKQSSP